MEHGHLEALDILSLIQSYRSGGILKYGTLRYDLDGFPR